jgi:PAS domain S-box-containing protein
MDPAGVPPLLLHQVPGAVWTTDHDLRITSVFGRAVAGRGDLVGSTVYDLVGSRDPNVPAIAHHLAALSGHKRSFRFPVGKRWYHCNVGPLLDGCGEVTGCAGTAVDVTARDRAERWRRRTRIQLTTAQRLCHVGSFERNVRTGRVTWSEELYRIFGLLRGEIEPSYEAFLARVHPDDRERVAAAIAESLRTGKTLVQEHRLVRPDGEMRELQTRAAVTRDACSRVVSLVGSVLDVTQLHENQRMLERKRSLLHGTIEATADGLLVVDRQGRVVIYNERFLSLWRIPNEDARTKDDAALVEHVKSQLVSPTLFERRIRDRYAEPESETFDVLRFTDGRIYERLSRPLREGDRVTGRVWSFRDVTERERALRAREELLSVVAHEIRSPITSIRLSVQTLRHPSVSTAAAARALDVVDREDKRLARFVDELIDVGRIRAGCFDFLIEDVDLSEVARTVVEQLSDDLARFASPVTLTADEHVHGRWDRVRLEDMLTYLLGNAMKFGAGKPIELTVHALDGHAVVRVTDHGIGIPPEMQEKIFEPYARAVSTRQFGGLGLGLYIAKTIVQGMGGGIGVESRPGDATTFTVDLPAVAVTRRSQE